MKQFARVFPTDFATHKDKVIKGMAAMFHMDSGLVDSSEVIIMAPDWESLQRAWKLLSKNDCVRDQCVEVIETTISAVKYTLGAGPSVEAESNQVEKILTGMKDVADYGPQSLIWIYDIDDDKVEVNVRGCLKWPYYSKRRVEEIGPAVDFTALECKRLLLAKGWSREDVREVTIVTGYDDIPF